MQQFSIITQGQFTTWCTMGAMVWCVFRHYLCPELFVPVVHLARSLSPSLCRCSWRSLTWSCGPRSRARTGRRESGSEKRTRLTSTPTGTGREGREGRSAAEVRVQGRGGDAASCGTSMNDKPITLHWPRYRRGGKLLLSAETSVSCFCSVCLSVSSFFFNWKGTMSRLSQCH